MPKPPIVLDIGATESTVCPCGTSLISFTVTWMDDEGVSPFGHIGIESITGEPHDCPEWSMR